MFIRGKPNKSGSTSIQIIEKRGSINKVIKTIGSSKMPEGLHLLLHQARHEMNKLQRQMSLFVFDEDALIESLGTLHNTNIRIIFRKKELWNLWLKCWDAKSGFSKIKLEILELYHSGMLGQVKKPNYIALR